MINIPKASENFYSLKSSLILLSWWYSWVNSFNKNPKCISHLVKVKLFCSTEDILPSHNVRMIFHPILFLSIDLFPATAQSMEFLIKDFFSGCDQIRGKLWACSHWLQKSLMKNLNFVRKVLAQAILFLLDLLAL